MIENNKSKEYKESPTEPNPQKFPRKTKGRKKK